MIKALVKIILFLLLLLIAALVCIYIYAGTIVKTAVETIVPQVTQTSVRLDSVDLSLHKGHIGLKGFKIGNPSGYASQTAFGVKNISVTFDPKSVFTDKIIINQVLIDGTEVSAEATYENGKVKSNLTDIQNNVNTFIAKNTSTDSKKSTEKAEPAQTTGASKQVVIRDLQINNSQLTVGVMQQVITVPLPNIQQKNIGEQKKKMTLQESIAYVFNLISTESVKNTTKAIQDALKNGALKLLGVADDTINAAKETASGLINNANGVVTEATDVVNNLGGAVKGLFGK